MKKKVIVINGSGGVGKDTFIELCNEFVKVKNISSIDKVREATNILIDWDGVKNEKYRKLLADLKKMSIEYNDAPFKYIEKQIDDFKKDEEQKLMFIHIREIDEIQKVKEELNAETLLITNSRVPKITSNSSDAEVENYNYDYYISNEGSIEELRQKAKEFWKECTLKCKK